MQTNVKKIVCVLLVVLMMIAVLPAAAMAKSAAAAAYESRELKKLDDTWARIEAVEKDVLAKRATPNEVTLAAYKAALNDPTIDKGSIVWENDTQFTFTVDGMHYLYCYRVRNTEHVPSVNSKVMDAIIEGTRGSAGSKNVLLVGPYYGQDSSFTNQYKNEATSIANATGGTCTQLTGTNATATAIASNYTNKGVVIYDSHGVQSGTTSYLCLTTSSGVTTTDYNNGWAVKSGSAAFIDGRYIQNHVSGTLSNCFVWMAICEGMKKEGRGTTGTALLAAGAGGVYGYSQSVSFTGDYAYEATFWTQMKNGASVKDAIATMKSKHGNKDPYTSPAAWPIVMSALDAFPSNPDGTQTVKCDWTLLGGSTGPVALTSVSVANVSVNVGATANVVVTVAPTTNVSYSITSYTSSNTSVATVSSSGVVTGKAAGTSTLTVKVKDNVTGTTYTKTATITVTSGSGSGTGTGTYTLVSAPVSGGQYIIVANGYAVGNTVYSSNHYLTAYGVTVNSNNTLTVPSSVSVNNILWTAGGNSTSGWTFRNVGNNKYMGLDSAQYLYPSSTSVAWLYTGTDLNNQVDSDGYYYLSLGSSNAYFTTSKNTGNGIKLYKYNGGSTSPTATPAPTATPKPTATPAPTNAPSGTYYAPATSITTGAEYLIGYTDGANVYLLMNYNPDQSN
ncbi:MAG: Ig-like domain-containing protein, partial [Clostridia bacterium]|nr:Ig-like domain-containing protein [Clostridia bacterium]